MTANTAVTPNNTPPNTPQPLYIQLVFRLTDRSGVSKGAADKIAEHIKTFRIPFAKVGVPFQFDFDFNVEGVALMTGKEHIENGIILKEPPETAPKCSSTLTGNDLTLLQDGNKLSLSGTPKQTLAGQRNLLYFVFFMEEEFYKRQAYRNANADNQAAAIPNAARNIPVAFNISPNPRDLWKDLPVKDYGDYKNLDQESKGECISAAERKVEIIAASQRGRSHADDAKPRDDAFLIDVNENTGWTFVTVADGAGSAKYSRKGSELATQAVVNKLKEHLTPEYNGTLIHTDWILKLRENPQSIDAVETSRIGTFFCDAVKSAWTAINNEAKLKGAALRDYHTTLLCTAFKYLDELKTFIIVSYWVGDGGAALLRPDNSESVRVFGKPDRGKYVNEVIFLTTEGENTDEAIIKRVRISFADSFEALILATDGITDSFFEFETEVTNESRWLNFYEKVLPNGSNGDPRINSGRFE